MTEANIVSTDKKTVFILFIANKLKIRKSDATLQWLHFARAQRHIVMVV